MVRLGLFSWKAWALAAVSGGGTNGLGITRRPVLRGRVHAFVRPHAAYLLTAVSVARRNWLTFSLESKTCATSGSIKTRTPPCPRPPKCLAKRFGRAFEKSYSGRISSEAELFDRVLRFLVDMTFSSRRETGADHSNRATSLNKGYHEEPPGSCVPKDQLSLS